eukprot:Rhum_TRINITY_DN13966_c5_g1::Rhum_TRINITY_DN13966_c5_g1_i1::g.66589::m.66589
MSSSDVVRTLVLHSIAVAASVTSLRRAARPKAAASDASALSAEDSIALQRLQKLYLAPYLLAVFCDWIQGPYQFRVYLGYGLTEAEIGRLYIAGFGSSLSLGTYIASLADVHGRKAACGWYCVACSLSCLSKNFSSYYILMLGRVLGGIATSLLFSAFEAWCVAEAGARHVSGGGLAKLFAGASFDNYVCAIVASLAGHLLVTLAGSVIAPFNAVPFVLLACWLRMRGWAENYGDDADLSGKVPTLPGGPVAFVSPSPSGLRRRDSDLHTPRGGSGGSGARRGAGGVRARVRRGQLAEEGGRCAQGAEAACGRLLGALRAVADGAAARRVGHRVGVVVCGARGGAAGGHALPARRLRHVEVCAGELGRRADAAVAPGTLLRLRRRRQRATGEALRRLHRQPGRVVPVRHKGDEDNLLHLVLGFVGACRRQGE